MPEKPQKVLITGGAGYLGTALIQALARHELPLQIVVYDNLSRANRNLFLGPKLPGHLQLRFVPGEILDSRKLASAVHGCDVVVHLAARVTTPFANDDPHLYEQVNHWGSAELSYILEKQPAHLIYLSSTSVYGGQTSAASIDSPTEPKTWYGISKLRGEKMLARLSEQMPVRILRCGNVYGYSPSMRFDAVINRLVFEGHHFGRIAIHGDGEHSRAFIHVAHVAATLCRLVHGDTLPSGTYNLIDRNLSIMQIAHAVKTLVAELEMIYIEQDMPRQSLLVRPDPRIVARRYFQQRPFLDELTDLQAHFSLF